MTESIQLENFIIYDIHSLTRFTWGWTSWYLLV